MSEAVRMRFRYGIAKLNGLYPASLLCADDR